MALIDELASSDDMARLLAVGTAARSGDPTLVDPLLRLALTDPTEVKTAGGLAEHYEKISSAAAQAVRALLEPADGPDPRIRAAALDPAQDDERVAGLLYYLGDRYEPLRRELETSDDPRLRLRALTAVLSIDRSPELTGRFLRDPDPAVLVEALRGNAPVADREPLLRDPRPEVRRAAAEALRYAKESVAFVEAARRETDPVVRHAFLSGLTFRGRDRPVQRALISYLDPPGPHLGAAATQLARTDDAGVAAAIASRVLLAVHDDGVYQLLGYQHLAAHAPELRPTLERLHRRTPYGALRWRLEPVLAALPASAANPGPAPGPDAVAGPDPDPLAGLGPEQRDRLAREAVRWALTALEPVALDGEVDALRGWLDGGSVDATTAGAVAGDCVRAAANGDVRSVLAAGVRAAVAAARRDPEGAGGTVVDPDRAADLTRLAHLFTARQIRAGVDPLPPRPWSPILLAGPDALTVLIDNTKVSVPLALGRPRAASEHDRPRHAVWWTACPACAAPIRVDGDLDWTYHDDDRIREQEDGFAGDLEGPCDGCGERQRFDVRLSLTVSRFGREGELSWDVGRRIGALW